MSSKENALELAEIAADTFNYIMEKTEDYEYSRSVAMLIVDDSRRGAQSV